MAHVPVADLNPGQTIASDVHNFHGQRLLSKGTVLTPKLITMLKSWGISVAEVEEADAGPIDGCSPPAPSPERIEKAAAHARELFRHTDVAHPFVAEVLRLAVMRRARSGEDH